MNEKIQHIKNLIQADQLNAANEELTKLIRSEDFSQAITSGTNDFEFLIESCDKFVFTVIEERTRDEDKYECIFASDRFIHTIFTVEDVVAQFIHTSMHEYCEELWLQCPLPKNSFNNTELDVYEEVFSQAMIHKYTSGFHHLFPKCINEYLEYSQVTVDDRIKGVISLFERPKDRTIVTAPHTWIYGHLGEDDRSLFLAFMNGMLKVASNQIKTDIEYYYNRDHTIC